MARDLKTDMETLGAVLTFTQNRDFDSAAILAQRTLASGFEHPMLLNVVATRLEQDGRFEESLRLLYRAVTVAPDDVGARNALALCLQHLDRPTEALFHVDQVLTKHPGLGFAHANKGNVLIALGSLSAAKQSHLRALELEPGNLAATAALASIATHRGEHEEAQRWAEQALATVPGFPDAVLSLAAAELASGQYVPAENRLQQLIMDLRAGSLDRARATGLLGDVHDAVGRYLQAFDAYTTCNEALQKIYSRFASDTSVVTYSRALAAAMSATKVNDWATLPSAQLTSADALEHVFLLGFPRSGTTLLEVILDGHPDVRIIEERELLSEGVLQFLREPLNLEPLARAPESQLRPLREAYWEGVRNAGINIVGKVFVDKYPLNTLKLPLIAKLFPRAKILFAYRDPRDVVLSCFRRRFKMNPAMYQLLTLLGATSFYDVVMNFADQVRPILGLDWQSVCYESLVTNITHETRIVCEFLGLEPVAGMDDFAHRVQQREQATPSTAQLVRGLDRSSIETWRHYDTSLQLTMPTLKFWVEKLGYTL